MTNSWVAPSVIRFSRDCSSLLFTAHHHTFLSKKGKEGKEERREEEREKEGRKERTEGKWEGGEGKTHFVGKHRNPPRGSGSIELEDSRTRSVTPQE